MIGTGPWTGLLSSGAAPRSVVFILAGQSNMVGPAPDNGGPGYPEGTLQVARSGDSSGATAEPLDHASTGSGMSPAVDFVRAYRAAHPAYTVILVPCAANGSGFACEPACKIDPVAG